MYIHHNPDMKKVKVGSQYTLSFFYARKQLINNETVAKFVDDGFVSKRRRLEQIDRDGRQRTCCPDSQTTTPRRLRAN